MERVEQWMQSKIIKKPSEEKMKGYKLWKKEIHYNAGTFGKNMIIETYSKGQWSLEPDIQHIYESEEE